MKGPHEEHASPDAAPDAEAPLEELVPDESGSDPATALKRLREKLKTAEREKMEYLTGWQRAKADLVNARKRDEEDRKAFVARAIEGLVEELVPVLQSFDAAMANKPSWEAVDKNWRTGVEYIAGMFRTILQNRGVTEIYPLHQVFDPSRDDAIEEVETEDPSMAGKVVEVLVKGYSLNGHVIQAPRVKVGKAKSS